LWHIHLRSSLRMVVQYNKSQLAGGRQPFPNRVMSELPVIREQSRTIGRVLANHFSKTDLSAKQKLSGRASPFWTVTAEMRKTVTSMPTRRDDQ
jgi:hypothetical protein